MANDIRIAVVGLGHRAVGSWIPRMARMAGYDVVGICDPHRPSVAEARARIADDVIVFDSYEQVLSDERCNSIALTVRTPDQGEMAARALDAGKHVVAEVPAAHSIDDCWRIVRAAEASSATYCLAEQLRFSGYVQAWRDLVADGRLGHPTYAEAEYFHHYPDRRWVDRESDRLLDAGDDIPATAEPTWLQQMPPIHYLPHELSPMLKVLDDRVVEVVAMGTREESYFYPGLRQPDLQMALMKTAKGTILRVGASFGHPHPGSSLHWHHITGTQGCVELPRAATDKAKLWIHGLQMHDMAEVDWSSQRVDAPPEALGSGHGDTDYYVLADFRDAVRGVKAPDMSVYQAVETAAPAILAADSIAAGSAPMRVPDFRPQPG